jgi:hypothetical protein
MITLTGGTVAINRWYFVAFSWQRQTGEAKIYLNGAEVAVKRTEYPDRDLMRNSADSFQIGYKADNNHHFFEGYITDLIISPFVVGINTILEWGQRVGKY